jgi:hypothetical protein
MAAPKLEIVVTQGITLLEASRNFSAKPSKVNTFVNLAITELQNILFGSLFQYRINQPDPPISAQVTADVAMLLQPYLLNAALEDGTATKAGYWRIPSNFGGGGISRVAKLVDLRPKYSDQDNESSVEILTSSQFLDRINSTSKPPTNSEPVGEYYANGFLIYPLAPTTVEMVAYQAPERVTIPFETGTGQFDFSSIGDVLFPYKALPYLTYLFVSKFGIPLNDPNVIRAGAELSKLSL